MRRTRIETILLECLNLEYCGSKCNPIDSDKNISLSVSAKSLNDVRLCVGAECSDVEKQIKLGAAPIGDELYILKKRTGEFLYERIIIFKWKKTFGIETNTVQYN